MKHTVKMQSFLDVIAYAEGTINGADGGYGVIVNGTDPRTGSKGPHIFTDYSIHPFDMGRPAILVNASKNLRSTASGRYQILLRIWRHYTIQLGLRDFGHDAQDRIAFQLIRECRATAMVENGQIQAALYACRSRWASLPGAGYNQPERPLSTLLTKYDEYHTANTTLAQA